MTRFEENEMVINEMTERANQKPTGTYEEMVTFQLGAIATMLADISKSLAIFADKAESDVKDILVDLQSEIEETVLADDPDTLLPFLQARETCVAVIQQKIDKLKSQESEE